ncbi:unnamed protein product [Lampetra planeri]
MLPSRRRSQHKKSPPRAGGAAAAAGGGGDAGTTVGGQRSALELQQQQGGGRRAARQRAAAAAESVAAEAGGAAHVSGTRGHEGGSGQNDRCVRHHFVLSISHPHLHCSPKTALLARCQGHCESASGAEPRVSFEAASPSGGSGGSGSGGSSGGSSGRPNFVLSGRSCRARHSQLKAVRLRCERGVRVTATFHYILACACEPCR